MPLPRHPLPGWLRPLPVRLAFIAAPAAWAVLEALQGDTEWAVMVAAVAAWGAWTLVIRYEPDPPAS